jgi:hypothetical protein
VYKEIEFSYTNKIAWETHLRPVPSNSFVPQWLKDMPQYDGEKIYFKESGEVNATAKKCIPMLDGIISGYTIPLWTDVLINTVEDFSINWKGRQPVLESHGEAASRMIPPPDGYNSQPFKYISMLRIITPPGYSIIVQPPTGHQDKMLLRPIPAIIDSDFRGGIDLAFPMWIKNGLDSVIVEKGTPLVQIIPFKRDSWKSKISYVSGEEFLNDQDKNFWSKIKNHYRDNIWKKKRFK